MDWTIAARDMLKVWVLMASIVASCDSARILVIQTASAYSHKIVMEPLVVELAARGHDVTFVTCFPHSPPLPNLREIDISHLALPIVSNFSFSFIKEIMHNFLQTPLSMSEYELKACKNVLAEDRIHLLWNANERFDLVIDETFTVNCYSIFAKRFNAPLITIVTSSALPWVADRVGLPDNPSYIPNLLSGFPSQMNFAQRLFNTIQLIYSKLIHKFVMLPRAQAIVNNQFQSQNFRISDMIEQTSLLFINSHFSISTSRPFPPNVIEVGGIHIKKQLNKLPQDVQALLDRSSKGAIVFSFGSLVRTSSIPRSYIRMFLNVFAKLPQTVIFKYEDNLTDIPSNVVTRQWIPQQQLMEHENVKAVITHGGLSSIIEVVHFAKPLLGIPFYGDQTLNINLVVSRGAGILLDLGELTEERVEHAIDEIINNASYAENMRRLSQQFRDRPMSPLQSAVYWTEYVIRHRGAPHLRPASVDLPLYQYLLLDVAVVLLLPLLIVFYAFYCLF